MGQVWSSADFDGTNEDGLEGGRGSILAVTAQNAGPDGQWDTPDDILAPMNANPCSISIDRSSGNDQTNPLDRVRGFNSLHPGGAQFAYGDGSVRLLSSTIDAKTYRNLSTISGDTR